MNTTATKATATAARTRFASYDFAGHAQEVATTANRVLTLVRFGKADATIAADLLRGMARTNEGTLPAVLDLALLRTADELSLAAHA